MNIFATMDMPQALAWGVLITSIATAIVTILTAVASRASARAIAEQAKKVDEVKEVVAAVKDTVVKVSEATDGVASVAREALQISNNRVLQLEEFITTATPENVPPPTKQTAQKAEMPTHAEPVPQKTP